MSEIAQIPVTDDPDFKEFENESLDRRSFPFKMGGKRFILHETDGSAYIDWQNSVDAARVLGPDGKTVKFNNFNATEHLLISKCLIRNGEDGSFETVPLGEIASWPQRIIDKLVLKIKKVSDLLVPETKEFLLKQKDEIEKKLADLEKKEWAEKNDQQGTKTGSS